MTNLAWPMLHAVVLHLLPLFEYCAITAPVNALIIIVIVLVIVGDIVFVTAFLSLRGRKKRAGEQINRMP